MRVIIYNASGGRRGGVADEKMVFDRYLVHELVRGEKIRTRYSIWQDIN